MTILRQGLNADVGLLLEGTFPYVSGGVSSWVNQIIKAFPDLRFALCFLGSRPEDYGDMKYALPDNVTHLEVHYMHEQDEPPPIIPSHIAPQTMNDVYLGHEAMKQAGADREKMDQVFAAMLERAMPGSQLTLGKFLHARESWDMIRDFYTRYSRDPSFVDYFWTVRIMHAPLWRLGRVADKFPQVRCLHTVSTGYAGLLGAMLHHRRGLPLILSEHGIYTKERKIDLFQAEWIKDNRNLFERDASEVSYYREMWVRFFEVLGVMCYNAAEQIIALYETNRLRQIQDGAEPARTRNIPNGVDIQRLAALRPQRPPVPPPIFCLLGRVVPIKDVKTFIRAMRIVVDRLPEAEGWIAGPTDEDPAYATECLNLVASLNLTDKVKFLGFQKIDQLLPKVGALVLSSISEALPLVILEGYAAGVPCIATDVGSCRQLVEGLEEEDRALGPSGRIVGIADPQTLALAAIDLMQPEHWSAAQQAGIARVERFYTQEKMFSSYRQVYERALATPPSPPQQQEGQA